MGRRSTTTVCCGRSRICMGCLTPVRARPQCRSRRSGFRIRRLGPECHLFTDDKHARCEVNEVLKSIEGIYRNGKVELLETPDDLDEARVIVTFLPSSGAVDLRARGIDEA